MAGTIPHEAKEGFAILRTPGGDILESLQKSCGPVAEDRDFARQILLEAVERSLEATSISLIPQLSQQLRETVPASIILFARIRAVVRVRQLRELARQNGEVWFPGHGSMQRKIGCH
jgi:hypothetical protein